MRHVFYGKFPLEQVFATPGVMMATTEADRISALTCHIGGDWGEVCESDKQSNDLTLTNGSRIFSAYTSSSGFRYGLSLSMTTL